MDYKRSDRVGDLIRGEVADILLHGDLKDPRIGFVTITMVKMTPDLKTARIYFSQIGSEEEKESSLEGLNSAAGYIKRRLAKELKLRFVPSVRFFRDENIEYSSHINSVLKDIEGEGGFGEDDTTVEDDLEFNSDEGREDIG